MLVCHCSVVSGTAERVNLVGHDTDIEGTIPLVALVVVIWHAW